jgi:hypothetical protein
MPLSSIRKKQALLVLLPVVIVAFICALSPDGSCLSAFSIKLALALGALTLAVFKLRQMKTERKASGLSEEDYLLKQAGGRVQLLSQASTVRAIGWFFAALPIVTTLAGMLITKSLIYASITLVLIGVPCIALGVYCLRAAESSRRAAARSAVKVELHEA